MLPYQAPPPHMSRFQISMCSNEHHLSAHEMTPRYLEPRQAPPPHMSRFQISMCSNEHHLSACTRNSAEVLGTTRVLTRKAAWPELFAAQTTQRIHGIKILLNHVLLAGFQLPRSTLLRNSPDLQHRKRAFQAT